MIGARTHLSAILEVLTPMHVGSGNRSRLDASEDGPEFAVVQVDGSGRPWIPGSTLKGVFRRHCDRPEVLFGPGISRSDGGNTSRLWSGKVLFKGAFFVEAGPNETLDPRLATGELATEASVAVGESGLMFDTRTAIDGQTGVAEKARLFTEQKVRPGTRFRLELVAGMDIGEEERQELARLLALAADDDGIAVGRGGRHGSGRVRLLSETLEATGLVPGNPPADRTSDWNALIVAGSPSRSAVRRCRLKLSTSGPFLVADPAASSADAGEGTPQIRGLRDPATGKVRLPGSTVLGALRAVSAWLEALPPDAQQDDPDAVLMDAREAAGLTRTQRLFGITGWRGRVGIERITLMNEPATQKIMSVRIDRFSGAPIDNALFGTDAWIAPEFEIALTLDEHGLVARDTDHFDRIVAAITDDIWGGLQLGLGKNRGFGSFRVEVPDA